MTTSRIDRLTYEYTRGKWTRTSVRPLNGSSRLEQVALGLTDEVPLGADLSVSVRQSANDPPAVVARSREHSVQLSNPDPALSGVWHAPINTVQWRLKDGTAFSGGLMLPRTYAEQHPVPLVIQAYRYLPQQFLPDGYARTAYAAQPLAAAGIAVLHMDIPLAHPELQHRPSEQEGSTFVEMIDTAVAALASEGLIDADRVGLIGFSRGGFNVYQAITSSGRTKIAAAIIADSFTGSYGSYIFNLAMDRGWEAYEMLYGAASFWENKQKWIESAPAFAADRVSTPTLFTANGAGLQLYMHAPEQLAAFRANDCPVDYLVFPMGSHELQRPRERQASLQGTVNWMSTWLMGGEGLSEVDNEQYLRWKEMRRRYGFHKQSTPSDH